MTTCNIITSTQLFNNQVPTKQLYDISRDFDLNDLPEDLSVSTVTITCKLDTQINIENIGKYLDLDLGKIVYIEYGNDNIRSLIEVKKTNKIKKKHKSFYNQATLKIAALDKKKIKELMLKYSKTVQYK